MLETAAGAGQAHRHAWRRRLPVGRPRLQAEARGEVPLHGFLDRRAAARDVRGRGRDQPAAGAGDLSRRRAGARRVGDRRLAGRDAPLRRGRPARPHGRARRADAGADGGAGRAHRALPRRPRADPRRLRPARRLSPFGRGRHPPDARAGRRGSIRRPARRWPRRCRAALEPFIDLVARRRRGGRDPALPWRPASAQHRAARRASRCRSTPSSSPSASPISTCSTTCRSP